MAITFVSSDITFQATSSGSLSIFRGTVVAGDMMIAFIGGKNYNFGVLPPGGWTFIGQSFNGTTTAGIDTGSTQIQAFYKIAVAGEPNSYSFSVSGLGITTGVAIAQILAFRTTTTFNTPIGVGARQSTSTGWNNIVSSTPLSLPIGAFLPTCFVSNTDAPPISVLPSFSASGRTFPTFSANPIQAFTTTTGGDGGMCTGYSRISAATNSLSQTVSIITNGSSLEKGHAFIVQLTDFFSTTKGNFFPFF